MAPQGIVSFEGLWYIILPCDASYFFQCAGYIGDYNRGYSRFVRVRVSFIFFVFEAFESLLDFGFREPTVPEILVCFASFAAYFFRSIEKTFSNTYFDVFGVV